MSLGVGQDLAVEGQELPQAPAVTVQDLIDLVRLRDQDPTQLANVVLGLRVQHIATPAQEIPWIVDGFVRKGRCQVSRTDEDGCFLHAHPYSPRKLALELRSLETRMRLSFAISRVLWEDFELAPFCTTFHNRRSAPPEAFVLQAIAAQSSVAVAIHLLSTLTHGLLGRLDLNGIVVLMPDAKGDA